jgi:hypothetical protein
MYSQGYIPPVYPQQVYMPPAYSQQEYMQQSQSSQNTKSISFNMIIFGLIICLIIWLIVFRKNGKLSEWSEWSTCDKICGGGTQTRKRTYTPSAFGGREDPDKDKLLETQTCNTDVCKIDGKMSNWVDVDGKCRSGETDTSTEISCGSGTKKQTRTYLPGSNGGIELGENDPERLKTSQWIECAKDPCPNAPGSFTAWIDDSPICYKDRNVSPDDIVTCGNGYKKQTRTYIPPRGNGQDLPNKNELTQWVSCGTLPECPAKVDASCTDFIWDTECKCINNSYKIGKQKSKTVASGGGVDIDCDTTRQEFSCNSNTIASRSSDLIGLEQNIKKTFTPGARCPQNGILSQLPDTTCAPNTGKDRKKTKTYNYTFPLIRGEDGKHDTTFERMFSGKIADINNMGSNSTLNVVNQLNINETYTFTVTNSTEPKQYRLVTTIGCPDVPITPEETIMSLWTNNTGCTQPLNNNIYNKIGNSLEDLKFKDTSNINTSFQQFTKTSLALNTNNDMIKLCYGNDGYLTIDDSNKAKYSARSILRAGFRFNKDVVILSHGSYRLVFQSDGNLVLYRGTQARWASDTSNRGHTLVMQHDGNLVIYNANGGPIWSSETSDNNNAYLELEDTGRLYIKNANGVIIKYLIDLIRNHLTSAFWANSPDAVFSDKKGRFFPFKWNDGAVMTNNLLDPNKLPNQDCTGSDEFRGWCRSDGDSQWNERELDLLDINNYSQKTVGEDNKPNKSDPEGILSDNYNRGYDRNYFFSDGGNKVGNTGVLIRKPLQFLTNSSSKSNYLPGYERISYVDGNGGIGFSYKFLIMERGTAKNNQAFVLYKKLQDKTAFAADIINNHPDIINKLETYFRNN